MKLRPDTSPLVDLSQHRRNDEYEKSSWLQCIGSALLLLAFSAVLYAGFVYLVLNSAK